MRENFVIILLIINNVLLYIPEIIDCINKILVSNLHPIMYLDHFLNLICEKR